MKCREAQYWLYSFQPNAAWPADVVGHLQGCPECQQLQAQLRQIDHEVNKLTKPPKNDAAVEYLLDRIDRTPQTAVPDKPTPSWPWLRYGAYLSGMSAMLALGMFVGQQLLPASVSPGEPIVTIRTLEVIREKPVEVVHEKIVEVPIYADRLLVAALLKRNAQLVQSTEAKDRLDTLFDMADDCRQHALMLIDKGPGDALPLTINLYAQLLHNGILGQLAQAPKDERVELEIAARARLDKMARPIGKVGSLPKALDEQRNALWLTAWTVSELVGKLDTKVTIRKWQRDEACPPALTLVRYAIAVCSETDAVAKAEFCADSVQRLMPYMMLCLADDASAECADMGQQFGELIRDGIYRPLEVATAKEPPPPVQKQAARIVQETNLAVETMEKQLNGAPDNTRAVFELTLDAIKKNKGKGPHPGKGKSAQKDKKKTS